MTSRNASFAETGMAAVLMAPVKSMALCVMLLLGLLVAAWLVDWLFVFHVWPEGLSRLQAILDAELVRTGQFECWCGDLRQRAVAAANFLYGMVFSVTGIHDMGVRFAAEGALSIPDTLVRDIYVANVAEIRVAMVATQLLGVRLATLLVILPLAVLAYGVAVVDGLVQRAIRRESGGRESSGVYHRAKYLQLLILIAGIGIFLLWAAPIDLRLYWVFVFTITAMLGRVQWSYYKKHL